MGAARANEEGGDVTEYIVDCEQVSIRDDGALVLPVSTGGHVNERLIRCKECDYCTIYKEHAFGVVGYCKAWCCPVYKLSGFCHRAIARGK